MLPQVGTHTLEVLINKTDLQKECVHLVVGAKPFQRRQSPFSHGHRACHASNQETKEAKKSGMAVPSRAFGFCTRHRRTRMPHSRLTEANTDSAAGKI